MSAPLVKLNDGNLMPILGLGTYDLNKQSISDAINFGYRHFDSAYLYKTEKVVGDAVNEAISEGRIKREDIFFVTKVWPTFYGKGRVIKSAKLSIKDSGLQYIDLLLLHWPVVLRDDDNEGLPKLPNGELALSDYDIIDVYKELEEVKRLGLAKSIGVSNFNSQQIERVLKVAEFIPVTNQVECHPYLIQEKLIKFCKDRNISITSYSPLGKGYIVEGQPSLFDEPSLQSIAKKYAKTVAQVLLRWQIQRGLMPIPRSATKERIKENIDVFDFTLTDEDIADIKSFNRNLRYIDEVKDPNLWGTGAHKEYPFNIEF